MEELNTSKFVSLKISNLWENYDALLDQLYKQHSYHKNVLLAHDYLKSIRNTITEKEFIQALFFYHEIVNVLDIDPSRKQAIGKLLKNEDMKFGLTIENNFHGQIFNGKYFDKYYRLREHKIDVKSFQTQSIDIHTLQVHDELEFGRYLVTVDYQENLVYDGEGNYIEVHDRFQQMYFDDIYNNVRIDTININLIDDVIFRNKGFVFSIKNVENFYFEIEAYFFNNGWHFGKIHNLQIMNCDKFYLNNEIIKKLINQLYRFDVELLFNYNQNNPLFKFLDFQIKPGILKTPDKLLLTFASKDKLIIKFKPINRDGFRFYEFDCWEYADNDFNTEEFVNKYRTSFKEFLNSEIKYFKINQ